MCIRDRPPDVDVHAARGDETLGAPHRVEQLIAGKNLVGASGKIIQQPEFEGAERNGFPGAGDAIGGGVDAQQTELDGFFREMCIRDRTYTMQR